MKKASKHFVSQVTLCLIEVILITSYPYISPTRWLRVSHLGVLHLVRVYPRLNPCSASPRVTLTPLSLWYQVRQKCLSRVVVVANANWKLRVLARIRSYLDMNYMQVICDLTADRAEKRRLRLIMDASSLGHAVNLGRWTLIMI